jgi:CheY-like chemotaxis protein
MQTMPRPRALVVEDSRTIAVIVKHFLELDGFEVIVAADGHAGLEAARRERPHVIVTDFYMPRMDGLEMVRALRADPLTRDIAVLMLSSDSGGECEAQALAAGVDRYLLKPVEPRLLAAQVHEVLGHAEVLS